MILSESRGTFVKAHPVFYYQTNKYGSPKLLSEGCLDVTGRMQTLQGFRSQVKPNRFLMKLNPHPCNFTLVEYLDTEVPRGVVKRSWLYGVEEIWGNLGKYFANEAETALAPFYAPMGSVTNLQSRMIDRTILSAYAKMKSPKFDGLTNLGELGETIKFMLKPMSGLKGIFRNVSNVRKKSFRKKSTNSTFVENVNSQWLEYRYAAVPLVLSVQDGMAAINHHLRGTGHMTQMTHSGELLAPQKVKGSFERTHWYVPVTFTVERTSETRVGVSLCSRLKINEQNIWGMNIQDIPATAYELMTLSFVLDWFFNVGDWIRAVTPDPTRTVLASTSSIRRSVKTKLTLTHWSSAIGNGRAWRTFQDDYSSVKIQSSLIRKVNPDLPVLPVYDDKSLSWMRQLDSFALAHGRIKPLISKILR